MAVFFKGIGLGLLLALLIGPVFFALIQTSIRKGFKAGAWLAVGISLSDIIYIIICYVGLSNLLDSARFKDILGIVGGSLMVVFGVINFLRPIKPKSDVPIEERRGVLRYILKGFALNAINPFVLIFWVGVIGGVSPDYKLSEIYIFFSGLIITTFSGDLLKTLIATKLSKLLTPNILKWMNRIAGIGLIAFGLKLLYFALADIKI